MKRIIHKQSKIERVCDMCHKPIHKGDLYRMVRYYGRFSPPSWSICKQCDFEPTE